MSGILTLFVRGSNCYDGCWHLPHVWRVLGATFVCHGVLHPRYWPSSRARRRRGGALVAVGAMTGETTE